MTSFLANAGTPFIWGSFLILIFGNALIAWIEAKVLERRYGIDRKRTETGLLFAIYTTALIGYVALPWWLQIWDSLAGTARFYLDLPVVVLAWITTFVITVLIEWPIVVRIVRDFEPRIKPLRASFLMNSMSYLCLIPFVILVSDFAGPLNLRSRTVTYKMDRELPKGYVLFVAPDGKNIEKISFDLSKRETLLANVDLLPHVYHALVIAVSPTGRKHLKFYDYPIEESRTLIQDFNPKGRIETLMDREAWKFPNLNPDRVRFFEPKELSEFDVSTMYWPGYDFHVVNQKESQSYNLSFQTPFLNWNWKNHTLLPDGWCVAELKGSIYLIDLRAKQVGLIARGFGSMVVLDD